MTRFNRPQRQVAITTHATAAHPPQWLLQIFTEIDTLTFGPGFAHMDADTEMFFGTAHLVGIEAIKEFFVKIDQPLLTRHTVVECWTTERTCIVRGHATLAKKSEPHIVVEIPFIHIYYLGANIEPSPHVRTIRITAGPRQTDNIL